MAICNIFKKLENNNGTFFTFSQYTEDLVANQSNSSYKVVPSRFICCDVDYSLFDNETLPALLQNNFENGCSFLRSKMGKDWNPDISKNVFWNEVGYNLFRDNENNTVVSDFNKDTYLNNLSIPAIDEINSEYIKSNIVYCGDINIQSYSEKDNVGYNEIYCYIPNEAKQASFKIIRENSGIEYIAYDKEYICGYDVNDVNFNGLLNINSIYKVDGSNLVTDSLYKYQYSYTNTFGVDLTDGKYTASDSFKFNTVVVFYDIIVNDSILYSNIPLGMYFSGIIEGGVMNNSITKFVNNNDIYGSGTSYGLRICNRFTVSPNGTSIKSATNTLLGEDAEYAAISQTMAAMADSQKKMDQLISNINDYQRGIKDHLASFKNYRVNVPYIKIINNIPYWFINGKNTGQKIYYDLQLKSSDDSIIISEPIIDPDNGKITFDLKFNSGDSYLIVNDRNGLLNIPEDNLEPGTMVYVKDEDQIYMYSNKIN